MSHEYCKQHPRPMSSPVMAAIRVRQSRRWATCGEATADIGKARPEESLWIIPRIKMVDRGLLSPQNCTFAAALLALLDHDRVMLQRELSVNSAFIS